MQAQECEEEIYGVLIFTNAIVTFYKNKNFLAKHMHTKDLRKIVSCQ